jgi:ABC-type phosphate/phosphonate transport system ATPase subunit
MEKEFLGRGFHQQEERFRAVDWLNLGSSFASRPDQLSDGQEQRVTITRPAPNIVMKSTS